MSTPLRIFSLTGLGLRNAAREPAIAAVLLGVVVLTSFGLSAAPRMVNEASDQALIEAAGDAPPSQRDISFNRLGRIAPESEESPFGLVVEQGDELAAQIGPTLDGVVSGSTFAITSPAFVVQNFPVVPGDIFRYFWFRHQVGGAPEVIEGSLPEPAGEVETALAECNRRGHPVEEGLSDELCEEVEIPLFETAITAETAEWLDVEVGDRILISPFQDSANNRGLPLSALEFQLLVEISGLVDLGDPETDTWSDQVFLHEPVVIPRPLEGYDVLAMGILAPEDYDRLLHDTLPARFGYDWRFQVDYGAVNSSNAERIADEVTALGLAFETTGQVEEPTMSTGIDNIIALYREQRAVAVTYASLAVVGLSGLTVAVVVILAALAASRRTDNTVLVRSRGARTWQMAVARLLEGALLFVPASLLGLVLAAWLVEGSPPPAPVAITLAVAVGLAAVFALLALPTLVGDLGRLLAGRPSRRAALRRVVIEVLIVLLAVASVVLLRRRGIDSGAATGFDPLLAAAPLLVSLAAGVVLLRLAPLAARGAAAVGSRGRGVVGMVGFRSLARRPVTAQLPAVVLLIGVGLAVFGSILTATISTAQVNGSWQAVGANYRIEPSVDGSKISPQLSLDDVPEVEATADAVVFNSQVQDEGANIGVIQLLALDLVDYEEVTAGTPAATRFPANMLQPLSEEDVGTQSNPIPVVVSSSWPIANPRVGSTYTLMVELHPVEVVVEEVRDAFPGLDFERPFVVMARERLGMADDFFEINPDRRYVAAPDSASEHLAEAVDSQQRRAHVVSRPDLLATIQGSSTVGAVVTVSQASLLVAVLLSVVAVVAGFALTARERTRDLGYLRAVGLTRAQMTWVTFTEQLPPALLATVAGAGVGVAIATLLAPSLDLSPLTGTGLQLGPVVEWGQVAALALVLLGTVVVAGGIYSYLNREMDLATILRRGDRQ